MPRKKQTTTQQEMNVSLYSRLLERHGFPAIMCVALMYALHMLYSDIKNIAVEQIKQTSESIKLQTQMVDKLDSIQKEAAQAHRTFASP